MRKNLKTYLCIVCLSDNWKYRGRDMIRDLMFEVWTLQGGRRFKAIQRLITGTVERKYNSL